MIIKRTDSCGSDFNDSRLKLLKKCLTNVQVTGIYQLNDHKGNLTVVWEDEPSKENKNKVQSFWSAFCEDEIEHEVVTIERIYIDLFHYLNTKYPKCIEMIDEQIHVSHCTNLFDSMAQEFYGRQMEDEKLYKLVKKYSNNFYCEWYDNFSQVIMYLS